MSHGKEEKGKRPKRKEKDAKLKEKESSKSSSGLNLKRKSSSRAPEAPKPKQPKSPRNKLVKSVSAASLSKPTFAPSDNLSKEKPDGDNQGPKTPRPSRLAGNRSRSVLGLARYASPVDDIREEKFGIDKELYEKRVEKYDLDAEADARQWLEDVTGDKIGEDFWKSLQNGVTLCKLMNKIKPGVIPRYGENPQHWLEGKANIEYFIEACCKIKVPAQDQITPLDMTDRRKDPFQLLQAVYGVARQAQALQCDLPVLGPKYYQTIQDQNKREEIKRQEAIKQEKARKQEREKHLKEFGYTTAKRDVFKILVVGNVATGKTSFIRRSTQNHFSKEYKSTVGVDFFLKEIFDLHGISGNDVKMQLWDIAGQERFSGMTRVYYKNAVGAFVVFDANVYSGLADTKKWKQDIDSKLSSEDVGFAIPVSKRDIPTAAKMDQFCKENGFFKWFFTSALSGEKVDEAVNALAGEIINRMPDDSKKSSKGDGLKVDGTKKRKRGHKKKKAETVKCPAGHTVPRKSTFCPQCGKKVAPDSESSSSEEGGGCCGGNDEAEEDSD